MTMSRDEAEQFMKAIRDSDLLMRAMVMVAAAIESEGAFVLLALDPNDGDWQLVTLEARMRHVRADAPSLMRWAGIVSREGVDLADDFMRDAMRDAYPLHPMFADDEADTPD